MTLMSLPPWFLVLNNSLTESSAEQPVPILPLRLRTIQHVGIFLSLLIAYFVLGLMALGLQSAQTGVSPMWPASGVAFALAYWFGVRHLLAIVPAMLLLAWYAGIPWSPAVVSAIASMLEAAVPIWLMRHFDVTYGVAGMRNILLFVLLGPVIGPMLTASIGTFVMSEVVGLNVDVVNVWLLWWLGNSLGFLVIGGIGFAWSERLSLVHTREAWLFALLAFVGFVFVTVLSVYRIPDFTSPLLLYFLMPIAIYTALRVGLLAVFLCAAGAFFTMLILAEKLPLDVRQSAELGVLYLDISLLWVATFSGVIVSAARHERDKGEYFSWMATHDSLTSLFNRHEFESRLQRTLQHVQNKDGDAVLLMLDLDHLETLNDVEGRAAGDKLLQQIAEVLNREVRGRDTVARVGGDEFAVLLDSCSLANGLAAAENILQHLIEHRDAKFLFDRSVSVSIGLSPLMIEDEGIDVVLQRAEEACSRAKAAGRDHVSVHPRFLSA